VGNELASKMRMLMCGSISSIRISKHILVLIAIDLSQGLLWWVLLVETLENKAHDIAENKSLDKKGLCFNC